MLFVNNAQKPKKPRTSGTLNLRSNPTMESLESREMFSVNPLLPGDSDCNGTVEFADFLVLSDNFGTDEAGWHQGDFDGDGTVAFPTS